MPQMSVCVCVGRIHTHLSLISHVCNKENVEFTQNSANFPSVGHQRLVLSDQCWSWILSIRKSTFIWEICLRPSVDWLFVTVFEKSWHKIYCKCQKSSNQFKTSRHWMIREESFRFKKKQGQYFSHGLTFLTKFLYCKNLRSIETPTSNVEQ